MIRSANDHGLSWPKTGTSRLDEASRSGETSREEMKPYMKDVPAPEETLKHSLMVWEMRWRLCRIRAGRGDQEATESTGVGLWAISLVDFLRKQPWKGRDAGRGKGSYLGPSRAPASQHTYPAEGQDFLLTQFRLLVLPLKDNLGAKDQGRSLCLKHTRR